MDLAVYAEFFFQLFAVHVIHSHNMKYAVDMKLFINLSYVSVFNFSPTSLIFAASIY